MTPNQGLMVFEGASMSYTYKAIQYIPQSFALTKQSRLLDNITKCTLWLMAYLTFKQDNRDSVNDKMNTYNHQG